MKRKPPSLQRQSHGIFWLNLGSIIILVITTSIAIQLWFPNAATWLAQTMGWADGTDSQTPTQMAVTTDAANAYTPTATTPSEADEASVSTPTLMAFLIAEARHSEGHLDAPVTILEFSDFK